MHDTKCIFIEFYILLWASPEKAMAPHSSTLAWKIPWVEEPGRLQSMGSLSQTWLSNFTFTFHFHALEKGMATHSSVLARRIPGRGEPGGLPSMGAQRVRYDWSDLAAVAVAALHSMTHSFTELYEPFHNDKALIHEGGYIYIYIFFTDIHLNILHTVIP